MTDPPSESIGYRLPSLTADAVTITHNHPDHNNTAAVTGATLVDGRPTTARQEMTVKGIPFVLIPGFHDSANGGRSGPNTMIRWTQGGLRFAHLGDLGQDQLTDAQRADLVNLDVLFLPAGGGPTISTERAAQYVRELKPQIAILMHYRTGLAGPAIVSGLPAAAEPFAPVQYKPATMTINRSDLPLANPQTWVMLPAADTAAVNAASFQEAAPVAPGSIVSLFGPFANSATAAARSYPLPRKLGETELVIDGRPAPLFYVSPGQVNAQVPSATPAGQVLAEVRVGGQTVGRAPVTIVPGAPGLFAAVNQGGQLNSPAAPARRGQLLVLYGTGVGAVTPPIDDGAAAGSPTRQGAIPNVNLMGRQLPVQFSGLTADFAGLWQINVMLPDDAPTGTDMPLTVVLGQTSNSLKVTVIQ